MECLIEHSLLQYDKFTKTSVKFLTGMAKNIKKVGRFGRVPIIINKVLVLHFLRP
jgi:hypothetical protein